MNSIPRSVTANAVAFVLDGKYTTIPASHPNFRAISAEVQSPDFSESRLRTLIDIPAMIAERTFGDVTVEANQVLWRGQPVKGIIVDRLLALLSNGGNLAPLALFLNKVQLNPLATAREELFLWLESGNAPICPDGDFIAFKKVRDDYLDVRSGTMDNSVGQRPSMPREDVDPDRDNTCSRGLHFCSHGYLDQYAGTDGYRVMLVKVNPADVVAIPRDYNNQKGRAWIYEVVGELPDQTMAPTYYETKPLVEPVVTVDDAVDTTFVVCTDAYGWEGCLTVGRVYQVVERDEATYETAIVDDVGFEFFYNSARFRPATEDEIAASDLDDNYLPEGNLPEADPGQAERQFHSKAANKTIMESELRSLLAEHGQRGTSRLTGVPRTTLQEWIKILNA